MSKETINKAFEKLDFKVGDIVFVSACLNPKDIHISQRTWLINSLKDYLGEDGTIIMELGGSNFDIRHLESLKKSKDYASIRNLMPGYSQGKAYLYAKDILATTLLLDDSSILSSNISYPYVGVGKYAKLILAQQSLDFPNGNMSPLARLYELRAKTLLINPDGNSLALNKFIFETDYKSVISINGGKKQQNDQAIWQKFLEKNVNKEKLDKITATNNYKRLFYFSELDKLSLFATDVRVYVDYCRKYL